jgi:hypothetical protein
MTNDYEHWLEDHIEKRRIEMSMTLEDLDKQAEIVYYAHLKEWCHSDNIDFDKYSTWENLKDVTKMMYKHRVVRDI